MMRYVFNHCTPQRCAIFSMTEISPVLIASRVCIFGHGHFFEPFFFLCFKSPFRLIVIGVLKVRNRNVHSIVLDLTIPNKFVKIKT